ncbi:MAG: phytase [Ignavibacteriaceae bacterium]
MKEIGNYVFQIFKAKYLSPLFSITIIFFLLSFQIIKAQSMPDCQLPQFGRISVEPDVELNGAGQNVDSIEFWKAPDSSNTLMFVTAKDNQLVEVWKYPFKDNEQTQLTNSTFENSQVNGIAIDQDSDLLYISIGSPSSTISVFSLPDLTFVKNFNKSGANYQSEPNLTILKLSKGTKYIYVSMDYSVDIHNESTGDYISSFTPEKGLETMAADDYYQRIYIPDENNRTGVYVYNPDGSVYTDNGSNNFGSDVFEADAEGIIVYTCPLNNPVDNGDGFIVVSDQRIDHSDFEFFDRVTWEHLGTLNITGVSNTDGIASYPYPLPDYPLGVFAAQNNDATVVLVGWGKIFDKINESTTDVKNEGKQPETFKLFQNYPNPFNPTTRIQYSIASKQFVSLRVYDSLGKEVKILVNEERPAGTYEVNFTSKDLPSGTYFYKIKAGDFVQTKKMILLR